MPIALFTIAILPPVSKDPVKANPTRIITINPKSVQSTALTSARVFVCCVICVMQPEYLGQIHLNIPNLINKSLKM